MLSYAWDLGLGPSLWTLDHGPSLWLGLVVCDRHHGFCTPGIKAFRLNSCEGLLILSQSHGPPVLANIGMPHQDLIMTNCYFHRIPAKYLLSN